MYVYKFVYPEIRGWRRIQIIDRIFKKRQKILTTKQTPNFKSEHRHQLTYHCLKNNCYTVPSYLTDVTTNQKTLRHTK